MGFPDCRKAIYIRGGSIENKPPQLQMQFRTYGTANGSLYCHGLPMMKPKQKAPKSTDEYIESFPAHLQVSLKRVREAIRKGAPGAVEKISYQMPTFFQHGILVHFAAWKTHIGFYPTPTCIIQFEKELARYRTSKGAVQFPLSDPIPLALIRKMVQFRVRENLARAKAKRAK
jgi:uncharacterized protein YdhG (YjbR/CyaY superfamily)